MKNTTIIAVLTIVVAILLPLGSTAQSEVMYPVDRYLNWKLPADEEFRARNDYTILANMSFSGYEWDECNDIFLDSRRRLTISAPFLYRAADSNTTHTLYGVAIPLMGGEDCLLDFSFPFDIVVYTGQPGDTTVKLVTRQSFWFDSGRVPDLWMRMSDTIVFPTYEFYFSQPITLTGLFFVGTGCCKGELQSKPIYRGVAFSSKPFAKTYAEVVIYDDSLVQDYCIQDFRLSLYENYTGEPNPPRWGYPKRRSMPIPDVEQRAWWNPYGYYMYITQAYYPILQPRNTEAVVVAKPETLRLMPNPASERVTIVAGSPIRSYRIVDMTGRTVLLGTPSATATTTTLNIHSLPRGLYCVQVETANGHHTQKLSVQ